MDLKDLTPKSNVVEVVVKHPISKEPLTNDDGSQMKIVVYAPHSKEYKTELFAQTNSRIARGPDKQITAEELEESVINLYGVCTKEWNITYDGKKPEFSVNKAKEIYTEVFWIRDQLDTALGNYLNFMTEQYHNCVSGQNISLT